MSKTRTYLKTDQVSQVIFCALAFRTQNDQLSSRRFKLFLHALHVVFAFGVSLKFLRPSFWVSTQRLKKFETKKSRKSDLKPLFPTF